MKEKIGMDITPEYFISDDDPRYYNAWVKVMTKENVPRGLLCSWHVIQNWTIPGKAKIKKVDDVLKMKCGMRKILKQTNVENFVHLKENVLESLEEENERDFLNYILKYYFQSNERTVMWAHCYRRYGQ
ncbi:hypothetical protein ILUMI_19687 [Ignelater luminosus]|uniref:MULE transposase domain-containing protein n=1 Tax=Ignelater luminosus TaxID=2038154 RepID=A0A8K0G5C5_IGNLU|nr:hypothetical protein ILUMI_19687 [Ignelater luminosus]